LNQLAWIEPEPSAIRAVTIERRPRPGSRRRRALCTTPAIATSSSPNSPAIATSSAAGS